MAVFPVTRRLLGAVGARASATNAGLRTTLSKATSKVRPTDVSPSSTRPTGFVPSESALETADRPFSHSSTLPVSPSTTCTWSSCQIPVGTLVVVVVEVPVRSLR